jgi:hypothetical protein
MVGKGDIVTSCSGEDRHADRPVASVLTLIAIDDPARPDRRAAAFGRRLVAHTARRLEVITLEAHGDRRGAIHDRLQHLDDAIVIMDVHGGGFLGDVLFDEDAEDLLQHIALPLMALGPDATTPAAIRTLMVVGDDHVPFERPLDLAANWAATFGPVDVAIVQLQAPNTWPDAALQDDGRARTAMAARAIDGAVERVATLEPWTAIRDIAAARRETVPVVTTRSWPGSDHWFATARALIRHAASPVIVVPY